MQYDVFIGLEIHVQLLTKSKMFCTCPAKFGENPNVNVCPICLGFPGMLPVPNLNAIDYAYRIARSLQCSLAPVVQFDRKNYYYPDLPKNYQITQFYHPCGKDGCFEYEYNDTIKTVAIKEAHLEEDAGKLIHTSDATLCDYNRSGTPLMEIVTEPELRSSEEAEVMLRQFRRLVRYLGVCDGNMEEGSLRCDVNISVNEQGRGLGQKVEIKNVNSFKFVKMAIDFEVGRQVQLLEEGKAVIQETRLWNENRDITESMRTKENADDYRYLPDPDITPYILPKEFFLRVRTAISELPLQRRKRLKETFHLGDKVLDFFTDEKSYADFFEETVATGANPDLVVSWGMSDVQKSLNHGNYPIDNSPLSPKRLGRMLVLLQEGKLHGKLAKQLLEKIFSDNEDPDILVEKYQLKALSIDQVKKAISKVLAANPDAVAQIKEEEDNKPVGFLMGQIMKETDGRADPQLVQHELDKLLNT